MSKVLVVGSAADPVQDHTATIARSVGELLMERGHTLLGGCGSNVDALIAESADTHLHSTRSGEPRERIVSWVVKGASRAHSYGEVIQSRLKHWPMGCPEPIQSADVVVIIGGAQGSWKAVFWAQRFGVPIVPIAATGGTAEELWEETVAAFEDSIERVVDRVAYERLNSATMDPRSLAAHAVTLAEDLVSKVAVRDVFVAMSLVNEDMPILKDAFETFKRVSKSFNLNCQRVDELRVGRISLAIEGLIRKCRFMFVDLSGERPNVYYELGFAYGFGRPVILTAVKGTKLHFDVADHQVIFYDSATQLETALVPAVKGVLEGHRDRAA